MTDADRNTHLKNSNDSIILKRKKPRYVNINENIVLALSPYTLKLYMIFRYESDYSKDCSSIEKNIKFFQNLSGLSRSQCFESMKELEQHGLLMRDGKDGCQSTYWIASDLNYFSLKENQILESSEIDQPVQLLDWVVQLLDTINTNYLTNINNTYTTLVDFEKSPNESTNIFFDEKSDYGENHALIEIPVPTGFADTEIEHKSDYHNNRIKKEADLSKNEQKKVIDYKEDSLFMEFYSIYPRKEKPKLAYKIFAKLKLTPEKVNYIVQDIHYRMANNWKGREKKYIPHPASYLNAEEWDGEIDNDRESSNPKLPKYKTWDQIMDTIGGQL